MKRIIAMLVALLLLLTGCRAGSGTESTPPAQTVEVPVQTDAPTQEQTLPWTEMTEPETIPEVTGEVGVGEELEFFNPGCVRVSYEGTRRYVRYVTSPEALPAEEALEGYDAVFFENYALILVYETVGSGSVRLELEKITAEAGVASVHISRSMPGEEGTDDMATWLLWAEVEKGLEYSWKLAGASQGLNVEKY